MPSDAEWTILIDHLTANGACGIEGPALNSTSGWNYSYQSINGTDDFGWNGVPGGFRDANWSFGSPPAGGIGILWTSSEDSNEDALCRILGVWILTSRERLKRFGYSVRCLKD